MKCWWVLAFISVGEEDVVHQTGRPRFPLPRRDQAALRSLVASQWLQRAIGVVYHAVWIDGEVPDTFPSGV